MNMEINLGTRVTAAAILPVGEGGAVPLEWLN